MKKNNSIEELKTVVENIQVYFEKPQEFPTQFLEYLLDQILCPVLEKSLEEICLEIKKRHEIKESENNYVIHYTSIFVIVSMLQNASKSSIRLTDSVHFNDPDEGNYLTRGLLQKYKWLGKKDVRHAYIASFILPQEDKDNMNDNLVFWRTYGQEGEGCSLYLYAPPGLCEVSYGNDSSNIKQTLKKLQFVLDLLNPLKIDKTSVSEEIQEKLAESVYKSLEKIRYLYKSKVYEHENECRFILLESDIVDKNKICFEYQNRENNSACIRHYYNHEHLQVGKLLKSGSVIMLGPCIPYRDDVYNCIVTLKNRIEIEEFSTEVRKSRILYRKT